MPRGLRSVRCLVAAFKSLEYVQKTTWDIKKINFQNLSLIEEAFLTASGEFLVPL